MIDIDPIIKAKTITDQTILNHMKEPNHYQIAKLLGIKPQSVYAWYAGKTKPSLDNFVKLSKIYGETLEQTLDRFSKK